MSSNKKNRKSDVPETFNDSASLSSFKLKSTFYKQFGRELKNSITSVNTLKRKNSDSKITNEMLKAP